jgi:hypothetical protein
MANAPFATLDAQYLKAAEPVLDRGATRDVWDYEIAHPGVHLLRHALELIVKACLVARPHGHELGLLLQALASPGRATRPISELRCSVRLVGGMEFSNSATLPPQKIEVFCGFQPGW